MGLIENLYLRLCMSVMLLSCGLLMLFFPTQILRFIGDVAKDTERRMNNV